MAKDSPVKYYRDNKEWLRKKPREKYQSVSKDVKKEKNNSIIVNDIKK